MEKFADKKVDCYGNPRTAFVCAGCSYYDSCRYYAGSWKKFNKRLADISLDRAHETLNEIRDYRYIPGNTPLGDSRNITEILAEFFKYLLELDEYTLGIITRIIAPQYGNKMAPTVAELGKLRGCTRQAMHRKLLSSIGKHPELYTLFKMTMNKISRGRQLFRRRVYGV